jgi:hypothetical protein
MDQVQTVILKFRWAIAHEYLTQIMPKNPQFIIGKNF